MYGLGIENSLERSLNEVMQPRKVVGFKVVRVCGSTRIRRVRGAVQDATAN